MFIGYPFLGVSGKHLGSFFRTMPDAQGHVGLPCQSVQRAYLGSSRTSGASHAQINHLDSWPGIGKQKHL
jgi:hypothetical protein